MGRERGWEREEKRETDRQRQCETDRQTGREREREFQRAGIVVLLEHSCYRLVSFVGRC